MNGIRTVRAIESAVRQRVNPVSLSKEHNLRSTGDFIVTLRTELGEILSLFDQLHCKLAVIQPPQEGLDGAVLPRTRANT
jgi:hypothetical protein